MARGRGATASGARSGAPAGNARAATTAEAEAEPAISMADGTPPTEQPKREPAIRTMHSDVSEFLKTTKPSLVSLLTRQAQWDEYRPAPRRALRWVLIAAALGALGLTGGVIWYLGRAPSVPSPAAVARAVPPPFIFFEETRDVDPSAARPLSARLAASAGTSGPPGSFLRLIVRTGKGETASVPDLRQLLELAGGRAPAGLTETADAPPQLFAYWSSSGPELGLMVEVKNPARALQGLLAAEPSLAGDLEFLFGGASPPLSFAPYLDSAYRNISFRYLELEAARDRGLGYLLFPSQRLIVMATSLGAIRASIDRLFENR